MSQRESNLSRRKVLSTTGMGLAAALAGCSGSNSGGSSKQSSETSESTQKQSQTQITYRDRFSSLKKYAKNYNKTHDQIHVNPSMKPPKSKYRGLISEITAGKAPEVVGLDVVQLPRFAQLGALSDLGSYYKELDYTDEFFQPLKEDFISYNGTRYALPFWIDLSLYVYNKKHFEEAGLDPENPPETWAEFEEAAKKLTTDNRKGIAATFSTLGQEIFTFFPYAWANGGKFFNEDKSKVLVDQKPVVEALEYWKGLNDAGVTTDPTANGWMDVHNKFAAGEASMLQTSGFALGFLRENAPEIYENLGVAPFPKPAGGEHSSFIGGNSIVIPKQTQENDAKFKASKKYADWVNQKGGMKTTLDLGFFPARKSGFDLPKAEKNAELFEGFKKALNVGHAPPMHPKVPELESPLLTAITNTLLGDKTAEVALSDAAKEMNKILSR